MSACVKVVCHPAQMIPFISIAANSHFTQGMQESFRRGVFVYVVLVYDDLRNTADQRR